MKPEWVVFKRLYNLILMQYGSVKDFSERILYNQTTVARKLRGEAMFTTGDIKTWCEALNILKQEIPFYFFEDYDKEKES